ncbi:hypothetical protein [Salinispora arenicola]|uniref:hypothetical protein n=1 Tax=Salinispora arenicola TaxID=168697 RepID=UPI0016A125D5|nr:hypothetical protein [Salinispora arenicola]NIL64957.1 hypothetical protein [Salinispora arenicola]
MPELIASGNWLTPPPTKTAGITKETTTGFTVGTDLTLLSFELRRTAGVCALKLYVQFDVTANLDASGNLPDKLLGTLPAGWWPTGQPAMWAGDNGLYTVTGRINASNGTIFAHATVAISRQTQSCASPQLTSTEGE